MSDKIVQFIKPPKKISRCSFCDKPEHEVNNLSGNSGDKSICNECVIHAKYRLDEESKS